MAVSKALVVRQPWANLICEGHKVWELRSKGCNIRGRVAIAESGSGHLIGEATITGCQVVALRDAEGVLIPPPNDREKFVLLDANMNLHGVSVQELNKFKYQTIWAWTLSNAVLYSERVPYQHPRGAVSWVKLAQPALSKNKKVLRRPAAAKLRRPAAAEKGRRK